MFADVVMGAERKDFDKVHEAWKEKEGVKNDPELSAKALKERRCGAEETLQEGGEEGVPRGSHMSN